IADITRQHKESGHPVDLGVSLEPLFVRAAEEVTRKIGLAEPIPHLAGLVTASPFDAALHDAFGKAHGLNCYRTYGPEFMNHDLGHWLGADFAGLPLHSFVRQEPQPTMPLYHLVGALDPLDVDDIVQPVGDGLPETLGDWIRFN